MDQTRQEMADRLKRAREHKGYLTATAAAEALGLPEQTYLAHENGSRGFRHSATRYARFFGVNFAWLLTGQGKMTGSGSPIEEIYRSLDEGKQREALSYLEFLKNRQ